MPLAEVIRGSGAALFGFIAHAHKLPANCSPLNFTDLYFCQQFLSRLDAPTSRWLHLANRCNGGHNHQQQTGVIGLIAQLILAKRLHVVAINAQVIALERLQADTLGSIPAFVEPSFLLLRRVIKQWTFYRPAEVDQQLQPLQLQPTELQALAKLFRVPIPQDDALAGLRERLVAGTLLLVNLPRAGKAVAQSHPPQPAPARYTAAIPSSLSRPPQPAVQPALVDYSAQVRALKSAASTGAPLCERCAQKPPAKRIAQAQIALAPSLVNQIAALKQAAGSGAPLCAICTPKAAAQPIVRMPPEEPRLPAALVAQVAVLKQAAAQGQPLCERCTPAQNKISAGTVPA